jgi:alpha-1,6-mannosyltransferase
MKICDIAQFYSPLSGGVKRYLLDKQRFITARPDGHHVLIIPSHRDLVTRTENTTIYEIKSPRLIGSRSYRLLIARKKILAAVEAEKPDLIEVGDPYRTAWIGLEAGEHMGIPVVAYYHSDFPRAFGRTVRRFAGAWGEKLISGSMRRYVVRLYNRMAATAVSSRRLCVVLESVGINRIVQVSLGTDIRTFHRRPSRDRIRSELKLEDGTKLLLFVGRMAREKNIKHLIAALDHLPTDCPPCHLLLVGDGELDKTVKREATIRSNLTWMPYCESAQRLADYYSAADLFVHPGRHETFGIVALEAQACELPVLAVREGGVEDAIADPGPPILARDGSAEGLAAGIARFLQTGDSPEKRAIRRKRVESMFSVEATFKRMLALYDHLIARRPVSVFPQEFVEDHENKRSSVHSR